MSQLDRQVLPGIAASPGIAVGPVIVYDRVAVPIGRRRVAAEDVEREVSRLISGVEAARREVQALRDGIGDDAHADHRLLLDAQLTMHGDELLLSSSVKLLRDQRINAEWALRRTVEDIGARLRGASERYFRERADDVEHVGEHILRVLTGVSRSMPAIDEPTILVAADLSPAEAAQLSGRLVLALVTGAGSPSSHTAILARALKIPAVVGVSEVTRLVGPGETLVVDALRGEVVLHPTDEEVEQARARRARFTAFEDKLRESARGRGETRDGERVALMANVELEADVGAIERGEVDGVGLYRTEYLYLDRLEPPSEEEQLGVYARVAKRAAPRPITFRTFDLGADKMPLGAKRGPNPSLGLRALRIDWERPELLVTQLRALLRASVFGNVQVMFPMVSSVGDLRRAKVLMRRAREDLDAAGLAYGPIPLGSMLEVPSAIIMADRLAPECDFFSLGTNDLTQYTLAIDRQDPRVAHLARPLDPAILRLIDRALAVAREWDKPISACGDLAADPVALPILVGMGYRTFSMPLGAVPLAQEIISRIDLPNATALAKDALACDDARDVEELVVERFGAELGELWEGQGIELPR
ncbi:MAG: phosphoenolpyruvate--protein phosphotransferase [Sandaracinaceae bacterium]|nr:phosphoenolpyruvate--protein phosphotransferase [Sandaracinaceae bacterium]